MKLTRYKHVCDRCGNSTIINSGDRLTWYTFKHESLCASCFKKLTEQEKEDTRKVHDIVLKVQFGALKYHLTSGEEGSIEHKLVGEEKELMQRFVVDAKED